MRTQTHVLWYAWYSRTKSLKENKKMNGLCVCCAVVVNVIENYIERYPNIKSLLEQQALKNRTSTLWRRRKYHTWDDYENTVKSEKKSKDLYLHGFIQWCTFLSARAHINRNLTSFPSLQNASLCCWSILFKSLSDVKTIYENHARTFPLQKTIKEKHGTL